MSFCKTARAHSIRELPSPFGYCPRKPQLFVTVAVFTRVQDHASLAPINSGPNATSLLIGLLPAVLRDRDRQSKRERETDCYGGVGGGGRGDEFCLLRS